MIDTVRLWAAAARHEIQWCFAIATTAVFLHEPLRRAVCRAGRGRWRLRENADGFSPDFAGVGPRPCTKMRASVSLTARL